MTARLTAAALLADNPNITLQELIDYSAGMDSKSEDQFWAAAREINPTLCAEWTD